MFTLIRQNEAALCVSIWCYDSSSWWVSFRHLTHFLVHSCLSKNFVAVGLFSPVQEIVRQQVVVRCRCLCRYFCFLRWFFLSKFYLSVFSVQSSPSWRVKRRTIWFCRSFFNFSSFFRSFSQNTDLKKEKEISFRTVEKATYSFFNSSFKNEYLFYVF